MYDEVKELEDEMNRKGRTADERKDTDAQGAGRRAHQRAAVLLVMAIVASEAGRPGEVIGDYGPRGTLPDEPPVYDPPPWKEKRQWNRRSAFRKGRR